MIKIIDNFLNTEDFKKLQNLVSSNSFPWYWSKILSDYDFGNSTKCNKDTDLNHQFFHVLYINHKISSDFYEHFIPILENLKVRSLLRMKLNLNFKTEKLIKHGFHCDYPYKDSKTAVIYFNTNDGFTEFDTDNKVLKSIKSVENRAVIFDANLKHTGTTCTNSPRRIVLNVNYF